MNNHGQIWHAKHKTKSAFLDLKWQFENSGHPAEAQHGDSRPVLSTEGNTSGGIHHFSWTAQQYLVNDTTRGAILSELQTYVCRNYGLNANISKWQTGSSWLKSTFRLRRQLFWHFPEPFLPLFLGSSSSLVGRLGDLLSSKRWSSPKSYQILTVYIVCQACRHLTHLMKCW